MLAVILLSVLVLAEAPAASPPQENFEQTVREADAARTADRMSDAIQLYRAGLRLNPSWEQGWWWLGSLYYDQDRFPEAQAALAHFVAIAPRPGPAYAFLGLCAYETRDYAGALKYFEKWRQGGIPGSDDLADVAFFHWALLLTRNGQFTEALYLLGGRARRRGESPALVEALGLASLRVARLPQESPAEWRERIWLAGKAAFYGALGNLATSREYSARLLAHYAGEPNVHYLAGTLFAADHKNDEAAAEYRRELQISKLHVPAMLGLVQADLDNNELAEAAPMAKRAAQMEPRNPEVHHMLGRVLLATGHPQESLAELELARRLDPERAVIRFHLATAYRQLGRHQDAQKELAAFSRLKKQEEGPYGPASEADAGQQTVQPK